MGKRLFGGTEARDLQITRSIEAGEGPEQLAFSCKEGRRRVVKSASDECKDNVSTGSKQTLSEMK